MFSIYTYAQENTAKSNAQQKCEAKPSSYGNIWSGYYTREGDKCVCVPWPDNCCGIQLNTNVPFIGRCIEYSKNSNDPNEIDGSTTVNPLNAFPLLVWGLSKIVVTAILVFSFIMILVGGVMMTMGGANDEMYSKGKGYIRHVAIALALLGASGIILRLINPNFFG
jgi:hypothetical protein